MYSGPSTLPISSTRSAPSLQQSLIAGLPDLPWSKYQIPDSTISSDATTITTTHPAYSSDPNALETFLRSQASLPPKPRIRILGRSDDGLSKDFDISLNMMQYIIQRGGQSQQWSYVQVDNESTSGGKQKRSRSAGNVNNTQGDGLRDLVERFCDDKAMVKTFTLTRRVVNWNTEYIEGSVRNLLAQMSYRGQVTIQFPVQHDKIIVQSPPKGNKFLHGVASLFVENKKYEGVTAVWPYATLAPGGESGDAGERMFAVQSEEAWWKDWKGAVANAVRSKRKGWVSVEDQIELAMTPRG
ncbi:MAG: hypothetical protein Q9165_002690 [Trypethelium subeluteriae]